MKSLVLVSTNDPVLSELAEYIAEAENCDRLAADGVDETLHLALTRSPKLILFDCRSRSPAGIEFCTRLRRNPAAGSITVVVLVDSNAGNEKSRLDAGNEKSLLDAGANECIACPVTPAEMAERIRGCLGRPRADHVPRLLTYADIEMNLATYRVRRGGRPVKLGPTEFRLLRHFMERPGKVFSRDELITGAWANNVDHGSRTVDVHVGRLRKALGNRSAADPIRTVRSVGYALSDEISDES